MLSRGISKYSTTTAATGIVDSFFFPLENCGIEIEKVCTLH